MRNTIEYPTKHQPVKPDRIEQLAIAAIAGLIGAIFIIAVFS